MGMSILVTVGGVAQILTNAALPPLKLAMGAWLETSKKIFRVISRSTAAIDLFTRAFLFLLIPNVLITVYLYLRLPETANKEVKK